MTKLADTLDFGQLKGFGPLGNPTGSGIGTFSNVIKSTIGLLTLVAIIWFIFVFISGAIGIISSGGDKAALESARKRIINGLTGLIVLIAAIFIIDLFGNLIGIPDILDLEQMFDAISNL